MPAKEEKKTHTLEDFADFLAALRETGVEVVVIGGCAIGAYWRLRGGELFSADLDLYATWDTLNAILDWAPKAGARVIKRPQPRSVPTAFLDWRGKEINILTDTVGLPPPADAIEKAREFTVPARDNLTVLLADPYDLLACKLQLTREKDKPHREMLRAFIEEEIVEAFRTEAEPRKRLRPARRYLEVTGEKTLSEALARRLLPLARTQADFRFLIGRAPSPAFAGEVMLRVPADAPYRGELEEIRRKRAD